MSLTSCEVARYPGNGAGRVGQQSKAAQQGIFTVDPALDLVEQGGQEVLRVSDALFLFAWGRRC